MFIALNDDGNRVYASALLDKNANWYCPVCHSRVRLRVGHGEHGNTTHFAHIDLAECDDFTSDMSEWHRDWQLLFPKGNREVVIKHNYESHRADVLCYGTVIEFQHSPISEDEFWRRNNFYTSAGYKIVWIFDVIEIYDGIGNDSTARLLYDDEWSGEWDNGSQYIWKYPWRFLGGFFPQKEKNIDIFIQIVPFKGNAKDVENFYIEKVVWVNPNYNTMWGRFRTTHRVGNYVELLKWLKYRWLKNKKE